MPRGYERLLLCRPRVVDMADHPQGLDLSREQALLVVCSTQVRLSLLLFVHSSGDRPTHREQLKRKPLPPTSWAAGMIWVAGLSAAGDNGTQLTCDVACSGDRKTRTASWGCQMGALQHSTTSRLELETGGNSGR